MGYGALIIEDEPSLARNIRDYLEVDGFDARVCADGETGLRMLESFRPDVVVLDFKLPDMDGLEVLRRVKSKAGDAKVVMLTGHSSVQTAVEAIKLGAYEYLAKPVVLSELKRVVDRAIEEERTAGALSYYRRRVQSGLDELIGEAPAMVGLRSRLEQLIAAEAAMQASPPPVLITGETGTGKELIARALHFAGRRRAGPFIEINCAALPAALVEGELFGHERGAFTDAREKRVGLIEAANGGTLFLDEVGELDLGLQAKLLRVLESRTVRRLGASRELPVDVRVVAATNRQLRELIQVGRFRADLYFRLSIIGVEAPPLRDRADDVLLLAEHFLHLHARAYARPAPRLGDAARARLRDYDWPGNVRELRNLLEQIVVFHPGGDVEVPALGLLATGDGGPEDEGEGFVLPARGLDLEELERNLALQALERTNWNMTQAGRLLNLSRDAMRYRVEKFNLRGEPQDELSR